MKRGLVVKWPDHPINLDPGVAACTAAAAVNPDGLASWRAWMDAFEAWEGEEAVLYLRSLLSARRAPRRRWPGRELEAVEGIELIAWTRQACKNGFARSIRLAAGVTALELAAVLGVERATVSRWENGRRRPRGPACLRYGRQLQLLARLSTKGN